MVKAIAWGIVLFSLAIVGATCYYIAGMYHALQTLASLITGGR